MKNILSFLSYHNAIPLAAIVLTMGAGITFAATVAGVIDVPAVFAPKEVDVSALLSADLDVFDFRPTVTNVVETDTEYTVSYSIETLAPEGSAWSAYVKTGEFSVAKDALPEDGLQGYVVRKLRDIENGEHGYLTRAKEAEQKLAADRAAKPASAFAALVGLALDQIPVPVVEKPIPEQVLEPAAPPVAEQTAPTKSAQAEPSEETGQTSDEKTEKATSTSDASTATSTENVIQETDTATTTEDIISSEGSDAETSTPTEATSTVTNDAGSEQTETASSTPTD
ncbi:MAG: hypothetical protein WD850_01780 [Candidatus Spechtbacterales bacterium]